MPPVARRAAQVPCCRYVRSFGDIQRRKVLVGAKRTTEEAEGQRQRTAEEKDPDLTLNPVELGRRSRQAIEDAWFQVTRLSTPQASFTIDDDFGAGIQGDLQRPEAQFTRVLVVGGTGRVGRIVVRKLLLRGYSVRVMCRDLAQDADQNLPSSAELVKGDVGNIADCIRAAKGMDKIIYCATSKLQMTGDIDKVDHIGVSYMSRAWLDTKKASAAKAKTTTKATKRTIADFKKEVHQESWDLLHVGPLDREMGYHGQDIGTALITEDNKRVCFQGSIFSRSGICEWGGPCGDLTDCEALVARVLGDGKPYLAVLEDSEGNTYKYRINTRLGFSTVWMPFNRFRPEVTKSPPMRPAMLRTLKFRFDKSLIPADISRQASTLDEERTMRNAFNFELAYIKAQPVRTEPTMILVSCASAAGQDAALGIRTFEMGAFAGSESNVLGAKQGVNARRVALKRRGEAALRASGMGYCIVRPSALVQEPGGYKALVFDQGDRIQQGVGYADVADVCLRALHSSEAVNKTFEVCYESIADDSAMEYELAAHMPDQTNDFLKQALGGLERNT